MAATATPVAHTRESALNVPGQHYERQSPITQSASRPCLVIPSTGLNGNDNRKRIILSGPKKSGKTSIAMNLACSLASDAPCTCKQIQPLCRCVAVTFFRPASEHDFASSDDGNENDCRFPLPCHLVHDDLDLGPMGNESRLNPTETAYRSTSERDWDVHSLGKIQVHNVNSIREILYYLLSIKGKALHEQPSSAIIIDDLDILASKEPNPPMAMLQTVALLVETSDLLQHTGCHSSHHIMVTTEMKFCVPWIPITVSLHKTSEHSWRNLLNDKSMIESSWRAIGRENFQSKQQPVFSSEFFVTKSTDRNFQIFWKRLRSS